MREEKIDAHGILYSILPPLGICWMKGKEEYFLYDIDFCEMGSCFESYYRLLRCLSYGRDISIDHTGCPNSILVIHVKFSFWYDQIIIKIYNDEYLRLRCMIRTVDVSNVLSTLEYSKSKTGKKVTCSQQTSCWT